ncbi:AAA family ATPase [Campylobacter sp. VBCF_06 NA8]|uniref:McrB family protein n=1 Tax=Campylobacter sp. VBCF_06 NA8 TaxID=2983822 RepID=UPI0022E9F20D|nr:AAA family ATPase [Campylobacter sp. VBCF_06 NA8]MDA3046883.1 AAA family ATPase [Campylobacter sp. VBCF_06 NA8]
MNFTQEQREVIKSAISEFLNRINSSLNNNKSTKGFDVKDLQDKISKCLKGYLNKEYSTILSVGQNILAYNPAIAICRKDILKEGLVNTNKFTLKHGIYVILNYDWEKKIFYTRIGASMDTDDYIKCKVYNSLNQRYEYESYKDRNINWNKKTFNNISNNFEDIITELENLINIFNEFKVDDFKPLTNENSQISNSQNSNRTQSKDNEMKFPLNQILYGPPGTGKTYNTIVKAMEIIDDEEYKNIDKEMYDTLKKRFDDLKQNGQIEFITFHQSYGYEEFVEGIKPVFDDNSELKYEIKDGIFKEICEKANSIQNLDKEKTLWRLYTLPSGKKENDYFDECIENKYVYTFKDYGYDELKNLAQNGHYIIIPTATDDRSKRIRAFGIIENIIKEEKEKIYRKIKWLWYAKDANNYIKFDKINFNRPTFQRVKTNKDLIIEAVKQRIKQEPQNIKQEPYILIIDEINRGNISKIFGELITLIEESKRIKNPEELRVALPYSGKKFDNGKGFGVPKNLYIIGTMNTANRSIALLDTALRRRFEFVEMMPKAEILKEIDGVNLKELLNAINERIEFLLDREHTIGHADFMSVKNLDDLKQVFKNKIIPLLQEYFYDDYEKIRAVLNDNGMITQKLQKPKFSSNFDFIDDDKKIYEICEFENLSDKDFVKIYE